MAGAIAAYWVLAGLAFAQRVAAQDSTNTDTAGHEPNTGYNGGDDNPLDPTDAGAAGAQKGGFTLSKGGLAAIIVVISLVVVVGGKFSKNMFIGSCSDMPCSRLRCPLLPREETTMGRPSISPSRFSSSHRPLDCRPTCYEASKSQDGREAQRSPGTATEQTCSGEGR